MERRPRILQDCQSLTGKEARADIENPSYPYLCLEGTLRPTTRGLDKGSGRPVECDGSVLKWGEFPWKRT